MSRLALQKFALFFVRYVASSLAIVLLISCSHLQAKEKSSETDLQRKLTGRSVVTRVALGRRGMPAGAASDYPVNTYVYPDGRVEYRVEWLYMRGEVVRMTNIIGPRTLLTITKVEVKEDSIELQLRSQDGRTANLKLLGINSSSEPNAQAIRAALARILIFNSNPTREGSAPETSSLHSPDLLVTQQTVPGSPEAAPVLYTRPASVAPIPGRPSASVASSALSSLNAEILAANEQIARNSTSEAIRDFEAAGVQAPSINAQISVLEQRLGLNLVPITGDDLTELDNVFRQCQRVARMRRVEDGTGREMGPGANDPTYVSVFLARDASENHFRSVNETRSLLQHETTLQNAVQTILNIEHLLDLNELIAAEGAYRKLDSMNAESAAVDSYLKESKVFRDDLDAYVTAHSLPSLSSLALAAGVKQVCDEKSRLAESSDNPLTTAYLRGRVAQEQASLTAVITELPAFQGYEDSGKPPLSGRQNTLGCNIAALTNIKTALQNAAQLQSIVSDSFTMANIRQCLGEITYDTLLTKSKGIADAQAAVTRLQSTIDAEKTKAQRASQPTDHVAHNASRPTPPNCHDHDMFARDMHKSAETRMQLADDSNEKLGELGITALTAGSDREHLLFVAAPEDADHLRQWSSAVNGDAEMQARFCIEGFADVEFIVRDQESHQLLIDKIPTDVGKAFIYLNQRYGAKPMQ